MRGKWILISVAAVAAGVGGGALSLRLKNQAAAPVRKNEAALIPPSSEITLTGSIRPQHITAVKAEVDGDIDAFLVEVGQEVFEDEVLARIGSSGLETARERAAADVTAAEGRVAKAEAAVANARMESSRADADRQRARMALDKMQAVWDRQQTLNRAGATPRQVYEKTQREYENAQQDYDLADKAARLSAEQVQIALNALSDAQTALADRNRRMAEAQDNLQSAEVRSPVDGVVVARNGEPGKPAVGELFDIATDMYALEVPLEPNPQQLQRIRPGQQALVLILDLQSAGLPGTVKEVKGNEVVVEFNCPLSGVKPGMRADVRLKPE